MVLQCWLCAAKLVFGIWCYDEFLHCTLSFTALQCTNWIPHSWGTFTLIMFSQELELKKLSGRVERSSCHPKGGRSLRL